MSWIPRRIAWTVALCLLVGLSSPKAQVPDETTDRENVLARFEVSRNMVHLLLPVRVQGKQYRFVLDTAATITSYDTSLRSQLGDPFRTVIIHTSGGQKREYLYRPPAAKLGNLDLPRTSPVVCVDLGKVRELCNEEAYGTLGMDFLKELVFRIDFDRGEVIFLRSVGSDPGVRIPVSFEYYNVPQVKLVISGLQEQEDFVVDTGLAGICSGELRAEIFDALAKRGVLTPAGDSKLETLTGSGDGIQGLVDTISLGNCRHKKLLFGRSKVSILGMNYWSRYVVTFDFPNKAIYLKKGRQFNRLDQNEIKRAEKHKCEKK